MNAKCPCCGSDIEDIGVAQLMGVGLSPSQKIIVKRLVKSFPTGVETDDLLASLYKEPDGGPMSANDVLRTQIRRINQAFAEYYWQIKSINHHYRLVRAT